MNFRTLVCRRLAPAVCVAPAAVAAAGPPNPPAGPVGPTMKTLAQVEPRTAITQPAQRTVDFLVVIDQPGSSTWRRISWPSRGPRAGAAGS